MTCQRNGGVPDHHAGCWCSLLVRSKRICRVLEGTPGRFRCQIKIMRPSVCLRQQRVMMLLNIFLATVACAAGRRTWKPNIVVVMADDLGIADIGYNADISTRGAVSTPILDGLAKHGTKLTRFYTNALCTPSRASFITGRFASRTNMKSPVHLLDSAQALNDQEETLPEKLKELGYQTHMVGKWHLGNHERKYTPIGRGFDSFCGNLGGAADYFYRNYSPPPPSGTYLPHDLHCSNKVNLDTTVPRNRSDLENSPAALMTSCPLLDSLPGGYHEYDSTSSHRYEVDLTQPLVEAITPDQDTFGDVYLTNIYGRRNVEVIERHEARDGPLFLYASFNAGHDPLQALDADFDECDAQVILEPDRLVLCAMIKALDRNVGDIVEALKRKGIWDDTVFVFASDNGGPVFIAGDNGPLRGGKAEFYEGGLLAPAFIHFGVNTLEVQHVSKTIGIENAQPIHLVDLFGTIVGAASQTGPAPTFDNEIDGRNLWPYLSKGKPLPPHVSRVNFSLAAGPGFTSAATRNTANPDGSHVEAVIATYKNRDYKLCRNCGGQRKDEIFDLTADPYEQTNLVGSASPEHAGIASYLEEILADWVKLSYPDAEYPTLVERAAELLEVGGLDSSLASELVNGKRCYLPLDSPEFLCSDCSRLAFDFPLTTPPERGRIIR